jgi:HD-GYP domain-containing protein (c-di-GMP phosphodiesterase class II)
MTPEQRKELDAYRRRSERDRRAQESAQRQLEELSRDLYEANERLKLASRGRLEALTRVGDALATVQDLDLLLARILGEARSLSIAEAGTIYVRDGDKLRFAATQNDLLAPDRSDALAGRVPSDHLPIGMGSIAGAAAISGTMIAVTDAHHLPDNVPYAFDRRFDEATGYRTRSVLAVPLKGQDGEVMGVLQLINRLDPRSLATIPFDEDDQMLMRHFAGIASVSMERARLTRSIITRMIRSVELRDPHETGVHASRVADLSVELWIAHATANKVHPEEIARSADHLRIAAMLHDIGKLGVSDAILKKPTRLEPGEMAQVRQHVILGIKLFDDVQTRFDRHARDVVLYHHARWDGTGYPTRAEVARLRAELPALAGPDIEPRGTDIPLFARIVALADVFDALISPRSYKKAWPIEEALEAIRVEAGRQFDPELAELFPEVARRLAARTRPEAA